MSKYRPVARWAHLPVIVSGQKKMTVKLKGVNYRIVPVANPDDLDNTSNRGRRLYLAQSSATTDDYIAALARFPELMSGVTPGSSLGFFVANGYIKLEAI